MTGTIEVTCSSCKETSDYELNEQEAINFLRYKVYGAAKAGMIQDLLPDVPAWRMERS